jgi:plasmid stabilization system protein ParE
MRIRWTAAAADDLTKISEYLKARFPRYRQPTMRTLYAARPSRVDPVQNSQHSAQVGR